MNAITIILAILVVSLSHNILSSSVPTKRIHVCPRHFVRVGRRCYFFSRNTATWQDAYYRCQDRKSTIAIIKTANQDRRIRKILSRPTHATHERWLGGMYNWKQMKWLWAASGKPLTYKGFASRNFTEDQIFHCIIMDPKLDYKWDSRPCLQEKPYICHTKSKIVTTSIKDDTDRSWNEIPFPNSDNSRNPSNLKIYHGDFKDAGFPRPKRKGKHGRRKKIDDTTILLRRPKFHEAKTGALNITMNGKHDVPMDTIKYETYKEDALTKNSLYPKPIVEQYSIVVTN